MRERYEHMRVFAHCCFLRAHATLCVTVLEGWV